jgi:hypothetical protein
MTDEQYQRLIAIMFLIGAASAGPSWGGLFPIIGLVLFANSSIPWIKSHFESKDAKKPDGEEAQKSNTGGGTI